MRNASLHRGSDLIGTRGIIAGDEHILIVRIRKTEWIPGFRHDLAVPGFLKGEWTDSLSDLVEQEEFGASLAEEICKERCAVAPWRRPKTGDELLCLARKVPARGLLISIGEKDPDTAVGKQGD